MLDHLLAFLLLVVLPSRALWRSRGGRAALEPKITRYVTAIGVASGLLLLLTGDWLVTRRTPQSLGLGSPETASAMVGIVVAAAVLAVLYSISHRGSSSRCSDKAQIARASLPDTPKEVRLFVLAALIGGCGWEILYRGFLLYYLQSHIGRSPAIAMAAIAYGVAHEIRSRGQFIGSLIVSFAFTIGYAVTGNLWWLMILHAGLPLLGLCVRVTDEGAPP